MVVRKLILTTLVPLLVLGACTNLSKEDRALLTSASQRAEQAENVAKAALTASQAAEASATKAEQAADKAAAAAQAASEKADRIFAHEQRKVTPAG